jgi:hypothetical protein
MLFAPGMSRLFATHPPLIERLKAIDPHFDPAEIEIAKQRAKSGEAVEDGGRGHAQSKATLASLLNLPGTDQSGVVGLVGNPGTVHMQLARNIRESLPQSIADAGRHADSARALLLTLALDPDPHTRTRQKDFIAQQFDANVLAQIATLEQAVDALAVEQRMPALLRAFPALRQLGREERMRLMSCLNGMLQHQGDDSLQRYVLRKLAQVQLRDDLDPSARRPQLPLSAVQDDVQVVLSVLAQHGHQVEIESRRAYESGMHHLYPRLRPAFAASNHWTGPLDLALSRLDQLVPVAKEQLVEALLKTVTHDEKLTIGEAELLRAVCASLHCPLPPLVSGSI